MLTLRQTVLFVALLNLGYFGVEFTAALRAGPVSLLADSADFLEDAAVNVLIFFALAWTATRRAAMGKVLAALLLIPALAFLWTLGVKLLHPTPPTAETLTLVGLGALAMNLAAAHEVWEAAYEESNAAPPLTPGIFKNSGPEPSKAPSRFL